MKEFFTKKNRKRFIICSFLLLFLLYFRSFFPKKYDVTYEGIRFQTEDYLSDHFDDMNYQPAKIHIKGSLYRTWFKADYFKGYIYTDFAPINEKDYSDANVTFKYAPWLHLTYFPFSRSTSLLYYSDIYFVGRIDQIYLELDEDSGKKGWSVLAPAKNPADVQKAKKHFEKNGFY